MGIREGIRGHLRNVAVVGSVLMIAGTTMALEWNVKTSEAGQVPDCSGLGGTVGSMQTGDTGLIPNAGVTCSGDDGVWLVSPSLHFVVPEFAGGKHVAKVVCAGDGVYYITNNLDGGVDENGLIQGRLVVSHTQDAFACKINALAVQHGWAAPLAAN